MRYNFERDLRRTERLAKPLLDRARSRADERLESESLPNFKRININLTFLDRKRYCRSRSGNELSDEQEHLKTRLLNAKHNLMSLSWMRYDRERIEQDHKRLYELGKATRHDSQAIIEGKLIERRLDALYINDPETKARKRRRWLGDLAQTGGTLTEHQRAEFERLNCLYPGPDPVYHRTCDTPNYVVMKPPDEKFIRTARFDKIIKDLVEQHNLNTSSSVLVISHGNISSKLKDLGYHDVEQCYYGDEAFDRLFYYPCDIVILDVLVRSGLGPLLKDRLSQAKIAIKRLILTTTRDELVNENAGIVSGHMALEELAEKLRGA